MSKNPDNAPDTVEYDMSLALSTKRADLCGVRDWLQEYAPPVPQRNDHALAKFVHCVLCSNAEWDGIYFAVTVDCCQRVTPPWATPPGTAGWRDRLVSARPLLIEFAGMLGERLRLLGIAVVLPLAAVTVVNAVCRHGWLPRGLCHAVEQVTGTSCPEPLT